jgi:hypothetical protein
LLEKGRINEDVICVQSQHWELSWNTRMEFTVEFSLWSLSLQLAPSLVWLPSRPLLGDYHRFPLRRSPLPRLEVVKASGCCAWAAICVWSVLAGRRGGGCKETVKAFQSSERDPEIRKRRPRPHPASQAPAGWGEEAGCTLLLWPHFQAAMGPSAPLLLFLLLWSGPLRGQQHHLVEYMERRLAALEVRDFSLF